MAAPVPSPSAGSSAASSLRPSAASTTAGARRLSVACTPNLPLSQQGQVPSKRKVAPGSPKQRDPRSPRAAPAASPCTLGGAGSLGTSSSCRPETRSDQRVSPSGSHLSLSSLEGDWKSTCGEEWSLWNGKTLKFGQPALPLECVIEEQGEIFRRDGWKVDMGRSTSKELAWRKPGHYVVHWHRSGNERSGNCCKEEQEQARTELEAELAASQRTRREENFQYNRDLLNLIDRENAEKERLQEQVAASTRFSQEQSRALKTLKEHNSKLNSLLQNFQEHKTDSAKLSQGFEALKISLEEHKTRTMKIVEDSLTAHKAEDDQKFTQVLASEDEVKTAVSKQVQAIENLTQEVENLKRLQKEGQNAQEEEAKQAQHRFSEALKTVAAQMQSSQQTLEGHKELAKKEVEKLEEKVKQQLIDQEENMAVLQAEQKATQQKQEAFQTRLDEMAQANAKEQKTRQEEAAELKQQVQKIQQQLDERKLQALVVVTVVPASDNFEQEQKQFEMTTENDEIRIGRAKKSNHYVVNHPGVSWWHAKLKLRPEKIWTGGCFLEILDHSSTGCGVQVPNEAMVRQTTRNWSYPIPDGTLLILPFRVNPRDQNDPNKVARFAIYIDRKGGPPSRSRVPELPPSSSNALSEATAPDSNSLDAAAEDDLSGQVDEESVYSQEQHADSSSEQSRSEMLDLGDKLRASLLQQDPQEGRYHDDDGAGEETDAVRGDNVRDEAKEAAEAAPAEAAAEVAAAEEAAGQTAEEKERQAREAEEAKRKQQEEEERQAREAKEAAEAAAAEATRLKAEEEKRQAKQAEEAKRKQREEEERQAREEEQKVKKEDEREDKKENDKKRRRDSSSSSQVLHAAIVSKEYARWNRRKSASRKRSSSRKKSSSKRRSRSRRKRSSSRKKSRSKKRSRSRKRSRSKSNRRLKPRRRSKSHRRSKSRRRSRSHRYSKSRRRGRAQAKPQQRSRHTPVESPRRRSGRSPELARSSSISSSDAHDYSSPEREAPARLSSPAARRPSPAPAPPPAAASGDVAFRVISDRTLKCANPGCIFRVHTNPEFGGYCCKKCHWALGRGNRNCRHGQQCAGIEVPHGTRRADAVPPLKPASW